MLSLIEIQAQLLSISERTTPEGIQEGVETLLQQVALEVEAYEEWNERRALAEEAWAMNGSSLVADLNGNAEGVW